MYKWFCLFHLADLNRKENLFKQALEYGHYFQSFDKKYEMKTAFLNNKLLYTKI